MPPSEKKAHFFRLFFHRRSEPSASSPGVDWEQLLNATEPGTLIRFGTEIPYEAEVHLGGTVIIARRVDPRSYQESDGSSLRPIATDSPDSYLARVNIAKLYDFNAFAVIGAPAEAPGVPAVVELANHLNPSVDGKWAHKAIMSEPDIEDFQRMQRARSMRFAGTVYPNGLFAGLMPGMAGLLGGVGDDLNTEYEVDIRIRLRRADGSVPAERRLARMVRGLKGVPAADRIDAVPSDLDREVLHLMQYRLTQQLDLPGFVDQQEMCRELAAVCSQIRTRVREYVMQAEQR